MNKVKELREEMWLTRAELARKAKVGLRTLHDVEHGANCHMATKRKILEALGIPFERRKEVFPE